MDSPVSPVPLDPSDDKRRTFEFLVPQVVTEADLLQFHAVDAMIRDLRTRRLAENKRLLELEQLWESRKSQLEPQLQAMVAQAATQGQKSAQTMLASTFTQEREDRVTWAAKDESEVVEWFTRLGEQTVDSPLLDCHIRYEMTARGRDGTKRFLLARAKAGLDLPPGVTITPGGKTVVTRQRASPRLTPQQILAQRGDLEALTNTDNQANQANQENQENQENQDE